MHQRSNTSPHPFEEHFDFKVECFASAAEDASTKSLVFDLKVHIFTEGGGMQRRKNTLPRRYKNIFILRANSLHQRPKTLRQKVLSLSLIF